MNVFCRTGAITGTVALSNIDIDGADDINATTDSDLIIVDDGGSGTNRKCQMSRIKHI